MKAGQAAGGGSLGLQGAEDCDHPWVREGARQRQQGGVVHFSSSCRHSGPVPRDSPQAARATWQQGGVGSAAEAGGAAAAPAGRGKAQAWGHRTGCQGLLGGDGQVATAMLAPGLSAAEGEAGGEQLQGPPHSGTAW